TEVRRVWQQRLFQHGGFRIDPLAPFQTTINVPIPVAAMHSFHSPHNSVNWRLIVRGSVANWPAFERGFPIVIYPGEATLRIEVGSNVSRNAFRPQAQGAAAMVGTAGASA